MDLSKTLGVSISGMKAESARLKVIAENLANANTAAAQPGELPYRRKVVTFKDHLDRATGTNLVQVDQIKADKSEFQRKYEPGNPGADKDGFVKTPNVNPLVEAMDMREAQRSYEADLAASDITKSMLMKTIDLLRS